MKKSRKVTLVGEQNPYGGDDYYALYPYPKWCSGWRLCNLILGMSRVHYLDHFKRVNLVRGPWQLWDARRRARELRENNGRFILFGSKVCSAWVVTFKPFCTYKFSGEEVLVLPHPSGRNPVWNDSDNVDKARKAVAKFAPEVACLLGECDDQ